MKIIWIRNMALCATLAGAAYGQGDRRNAVISGGGRADQGKCTIEVMVDDVAEVEVRGTSATLRTLSGQPAQWKRFVCSSAMPIDPAGFKFSGVDGRGRQTLTGDPRNGGVAVVRIEDKENGSEGYTFDLTWDARGQGYNGNGNNVPYNNVPYNNGANNNGNYNNGSYNNGSDRGNGRYRQDNQGQNRGDDGQYRPTYRDSDYYHRYSHGFGRDEAVRICQNEVSRQATSRFGNSDIHFYRTNADSNQGREDWITGMIDVHRGDRREQYRFSCSVDFDNGRVRSVDLDNRPTQGNW